MSRKIDSEYPGYFEIVEGRQSRLVQAAKAIYSATGEFGTIAFCSFVFIIACAAMFANGLPYADDYNLIAAQRQDGYWAPTAMFQAMWGYCRMIYTTLMAPVYWYLGEHLWLMRSAGLLLHVATAALLFLVTKSFGMSGPARYLTFALFLFFPYSLEAIAWPANVTQYPLALFLAIAGASLLLLPNQNVFILSLGALLLGGAFWVHEQVGPVTVLFLVLCIVLKFSRRRATAATMVLTLILGNVALLYFTRGTNIRLSGPAAGTFGNIISNFRYFEQLVRTTPIGDFYYAAGGIAPSFAWIALIVLCASAVFLSGLLSPSPLPPGMATPPRFLATSFVMALGAYVVSLVPILMSPFPWHTGRVIYIPFLAFALAAGFAAELFIRIHSFFRVTGAAIAALVVLWGSLALQAEAEAFDFQTRVNFSRSSALSALVGTEIKQGKTALIVGGFPGVDTARPYFGEHFIGMTPGELKSMLGMRISGPSPFPLLISGASTAHFCKSHEIVAGKPAMSSEALLLREANKTIIALWHNDKWVIQRDLPNPELQDFLPRLQPCIAD